MTVLVGYLPSPEGEAALSRALSEAALRSTGVIIINAARLGAAIDVALASDQDLARVRASAAEHNVAVEIRQTLDGQAAADHLIDASAEDGVELTVIGVRRRSLVGKLVLGSTAQRVLMEAHTAVLAVKA
jgi:nucleotide-binding universal stress UspA family protein